MIGKLLNGAAAALIACSTAQIALAKPRVSVSTKYYTVSGTTAAQLKAQMRAKGRRGKWGYTDWYVRWTGGCRVSLTITYTYPRWVNRSKAPVALRKRWDRMTASLRTHERGHGRYGINAAAEVERSRCRGNPKSITNKWARQDKVYDRRTRGGATQGVVLP